MQSNILIAKPENLEITMTAQTTQTAAHVVAMNSRTRFSFGRTFLNTLAAGKPHHDIGKLSAFLVAAGVATPAKIKDLAKKQELTAQVLSDVAIGVVALTPADQLPARFTLQ